MKQICTGEGQLLGGTNTSQQAYMKHGATKDDLQKLFAHSSPEVTARYLHGRNDNLEKVAKVIRLFDPKRQSTTKIDDVGDSGSAGNGK